LTPKTPDLYPRCEPILMSASVRSLRRFVGVLLGTLSLAVAACGSVASNKPGGTGGAGGASAGTGGRGSGGTAAGTGGMALGSGGMTGGSGGAGVGTGGAGGGAPGPCIIDTSQLDNCVLQ
jgi:hypothetical protein